MTVGRRGRKESRPGEGAPSKNREVLKRRFLRRLGDLADVAIGEQVVFSYESSLSFVPDRIKVGYTPTPDQIAAQCEKLQESWSRKRRRHANKIKPVEIVDYQTRDLWL